MQHLLVSQRDLEFLLYEWLQVQSLCERERFAEHSRETFDAALRTSAELAADHFYPINPLLDREEPHFDGQQVHTPAPLKQALKAFCDAGLMAAGQPFEFGGMQLPCVVEKACFAWFNAASVSAAGYPFLTIGNANLLQVHGSPDQKRRYVEPMMSGRFFGTMCLSEPQAGSSLSDIRTRAVRQADGRYRLTGNKMWISGGDQDLSENIVHLVLAKVPDASGRLVPGVKGISLFIVPKVLVNEDGSLGERNDVVLAGLNHKMGYRGTTNTLLNFGEGRFKPHGQAGAIGELVGDEGQGLAQMFHMMNEARIGVGLGATMLAYTAYLHALEYAKQRPQGRLVTNKDPASAQVRIIEHADVKRMLLMQKAFVEGALALNLYCSRLVDDTTTHPQPGGRDHANLLLELLTPIAKSWPSQWGQEANSQAIQVHGGYGYTKDYRVEQFYRDQRLNPIHEGTHGIQALDLLGRKLRMNQGAAWKALQAEVQATLENARRCAGQGADEVHELAQAVGLAFSRIQTTLDTLEGPERLAIGLSNAAPFLEAFGHAVLGWIWLDQVIAAQHALATHPDPQKAAFYLGKLQAAMYFGRWELPKINAWLDVVKASDTTTLSMQEDWF